MDLYLSRRVSEVGFNSFLQHLQGPPLFAQRHFPQSLCGLKHTEKKHFHGLRIGQSTCSLSQRTQLLSLNNGIVCRGLREGSGGNHSSEEDEPDKDQDSAVPQEDDKVDEASHEADWRAFRASLVAGEQDLGKESKLHDASETSAMGLTKALGKTWAHPLCVPEAGCVLVATDKLDGQIDFERTVILLLRVGSNKPREGPFGVILNRPTLQTINSLEPENRTLADVFGNCPYFYGGPLESELFLLMQEGGSHKYFGEIIPGISHIGLGGLQHAAHLLKDGAVTANDFRFYVGYAGWGFDQLMHEIASGYWHVAACSTSLLRLTSTDRLWQKTLKLMGGQYAELGRKPNKNGL